MMKLSGKLIFILINLLNFLDDKEEEECGSFKVFFILILYIKRKG